MLYSNNLVSIILPVYNAEKFLDECLNSILIQTYSNFELIIINDGSKDNSLSICQKYKNQDSRILLIDVVNGGVSKARNIGILHASGDWLCFVDSDDWIGENFVMNFVLKFPDEDCLIVQEITKYSNETFKPTKSYTYKKFEVSDFKELLNHNKILANGYTVSKFYNRKVILEKKIFFDEKLIFAEDLMFYLSYIKNIKYIEFSKNTEYFYRIHNNSASFRSFEFRQLFLSFITLKKKLKCFLSEDKWTGCNEIEKSISMFFYLCLYSIYDSRNPKLQKSERLNFLKVLNIESDLTIFFNNTNKFDLGKKYYIKLMDKNKLTKVDFFLLFYVKFDLLLIRKFKLIFYNLRHIL